ncbi:MAG: tol-pal system protein YbgF [Pseudomonadales bacterium]|nr:tol-pal system protein YbgF [Pseudomonadales bacterium]
MAGVIFTLVAPFSFAAQNNPVAVESLDTDSAQVRELPFQAPAETVAGNPMETQYQMQLLQQEVQELRGIVEELQYQLQRFRKTQDDRYLELDGRFQDMREQLATGGTLNMSEPGSSAVLPADPETGTGGGLTAAESQNEKALYETALELIRNRQYDLAITQLQAVIANYPEGELAPNAYYWLGEVFAAKPEPDYEGARQALAQVITFFPDHRKVPDAAFKLGKVYHLMGDCSRARELLDQVIEQHDGKSVAKLASNYVRDKMANCQQ